MTSYYAATPFLIRLILLYLAVSFLVYNVLTEYKKSKSWWQAVPSAIAITLVAPVMIVYTFITERKSNDS